MLLALLLTTTFMLAGKVNGQWRSMMAGFEMFSYILAITLPDAHDFWILACMSATMVFLAALIFSYAHKAHNAEVDNQHSSVLSTV